MALLVLPRSTAVFESVFPSPQYTSPTPEVTPEIGVLSSPGQSFGGFRSTSNVIEETLQLTGAWSTATSWLKSCLKSKIVLGQQQLQAFDLLSRSERERRALTGWYINEVTTHFTQAGSRYRSLCTAWTSGHSQEAARMLAVLLDDVKQCRLEAQEIDKQHWSENSIALLQSLGFTAFERWCSLVSSMDFRADIQQALANALYMSMQRSSDESAKATCWRSKRCQCRFGIDDIPLHDLGMVGLGGDTAERAMAMAIAKFLGRVVVEKRCFQVDWQHHASCAARLEDWTRSVVAPMVHQTLCTIESTKNRLMDSHVDVLVETAISNLGSSRIASIFDYIKVWPHSTGAIDDIKALLALDRPADKALVCSSTESQLQQRLLHAGASTAEVLGVYVNLINVFRKLDARGVLLEKVSPVIRTYLRARNDAVNVLATSLFADMAVSGDEKSDPSPCPSITRELEYAVQDNTNSVRSMDWDDMSWVPEPIDASTVHKSAKTADVLSHVLSLFDPEDVIKEVESVLAEHLLSTNDPEVVKETRLVELLKTRLDAAKLQNSEVMLKDMRDSVNFERRLRPQLSPRSVPTLHEIQAAIPAQGISAAALLDRFKPRITRTELHEKLRQVAVRRSGLFYPKRGRLVQDPQPQAVSDADSGPKVQYRILSSSSWPQMQNATFAMPAGVESHLQSAEDRFSSVSGQRKLRWRPALTKMSITLELEDRTVQENDSPAWRVAVINAFGSDTTSTSAGRTAEDLVALLNMDASLVQDALAYWSSRRVLYQQSPGTYAVLERLDMDIDEEQIEATESEAVRSLRSQDAMLHDNAAMFEAFITNMLSNGGPKEIGGMMGITNMMKMVLPTFTYGDEEVKWLLGLMKSRGLVEEDGDSWKAVQ